MPHLPGSDQARRFDLQILDYDIEKFSIILEKLPNQASKIPRIYRLFISYSFENRYGMIRKIQQNDSKLT